MNQMNVQNPIRTPLIETATPGAIVESRGASSWRLEIPAGPPGRYRLAQVDDYAQSKRGEFPWAPPLQFQLDAKISTAANPGTWGFGFWNDPFSLSLGLGGGTRRLPALPNAAWFFFSSPENHLSFQDQLPGSGPLAQVFQSPAIPSAGLAPAAFALPLLAWRPAARLARRLARLLIREDAAKLQISPEHWNHYHLTWSKTETVFIINGQVVLRTPCSPQPPLGWVAWVDNQFAALPPSGKLRFGSLQTPNPVSLEIKNLSIDPF
jgi:hypothetical protein